MSWAHGFIELRDGTKMQVGYGIGAICERDGCGAVIDRGLSYRCGGCDFDAGCGHYFCGAHLYWVEAPGDQLCFGCMDDLDA
jgi:hypothetical protein